MFLESSTLLFVQFKVDDYIGDALVDIGKSLNLYSSAVPLKLRYKRWDNGKVTVRLDDESIVSNQLTCNTLVSIEPS